MPAPDETRLEIGYGLASEEHAPRALIRNARRPEEAGFTSAMISDHYPPWTERQGESPFIWSVLGAIARGTSTFASGPASPCRSCGSIPRSSRRRQRRPPA